MTDYEYLALTLNIWFAYVVKEPSVIDTTCEINTDPSKVTPFLHITHSSDPVIILMMHLQDTVVVF